MNRTLIESLELLIASKLQEVHTAIPARIESYEGHGTRKANVTPLVKLTTVSGMVVEPLPIHGIPVVFPSTSDFSMLFPLPKGTMGILYTSESSIGSWMAGDGDVSVANDPTRFTLSDSFFVPGLFPWSQVPDFSGDPNSALIQYKGAVIELTNSGTVNITGDVTITGKLTTSKDITAQTGDIKAQAGDVTAQMVTMLTHVHPHPLGPTSMGVG